MTRADHAAMATALARFAAAARRVGNAPAAERLTAEAGAHHALACGMPGFVAGSRIPVDGGES